MFKENRFIFQEIVPPRRRRKKGGGFESYKPKEYKKTLSGKLEQIEREVSAEEAQRVLERLDEFGEMQCPKCKSKTVTEDDTDPKLYKFLCFDCGHKWQIKKNRSKKNGPKN